MSLYSISINEIPDSPKTLIKACDEIQMGNNDYLLCNFTHIPINSSNEYPEINISDIQSLLIKTAGQYCQSYASDILMTICDLEPFAKKEIDKNNNRWIISAGFRDMGVDHNSFIMIRLNESLDPSSKLMNVHKYYKKILAIDIEDTLKTDISFNDNYLKRTISLKDITNHLNTIDQSDINMVS